MSQSGACAQAQIEGVDGQKAEQGLVLLPCLYGVAVLHREKRDSTSKSLGCLFR